MFKSHEFWNTGKHPILGWFTGSIKVLSAQQRRDIRKQKLDQVQPIKDDVHS